MKVSWDDDIPNWMEKIDFMFQTTNQVIMKKSPINSPTTIIL